MKARVAYHKLQKPLIVVDNILCFNALEGLPGIYTSDFYDRLGIDGLYKLLSGKEDKSAIFQTTIAYISQKNINEPLIFTDAVVGKIVEPRGS